MKKYKSNNLKLMYTTGATSWISTNVYGEDSGRGTLEGPYVKKHQTLRLLSIQQKALALNKYITPGTMKHLHLGDTTFIESQDKYIVHNNKNTW